jgi:hypothetical protein
MPLSDRIEQLQTALLYCTISRNLRRTAYWSIGWGSLVLAIAIGISVSRKIDFVGIAFAVALIGEGLYLILSKKPITVLVEGATLALLSLWIVVGLVSAYITHTRAGNPIGAIFLAIGAWNMFSTYRTYKLVSESADPDAIRVCREQLEVISKAESDCVVAMEWDKNFESNDTWAASFIDDVVLFVNGPRKAFRKKLNISSGVWVRRQSVRIENTGDAWLGKKIKAQLYQGEEPFLKVKIGREDYDRLQNLLLRGPQVQPVATPVDPVVR